MGLLKEHAPFGEGIDIGSLGLWVASETTDPVIQIINGKKEDVWSFSSLQEETYEA
tara:strand:- start:3124 stop:3291 length:168 start_codon:yes stop_codon:yes gene_type:complete